MKISATPNGGDSAWPLDQLSPGPILPGFHDLALDKFRIQRFRGLWRLPPFLVACNASGVPNVLRRAFFPPQNAASTTISPLVPTCYTCFRPAGKNPISYGLPPPVRIVLFARPGTFLPDLTNSEVHLRRYTFGGRPRRRMAGAGTHHVAGFARIQPLSRSPSEFLKFSDKPVPAPSVTGETDENRFDAPRRQAG